MQYEQLFLALIQLSRLLWLRNDSTSVNNNFGILGDSNNAVSVNNGNWIPPQKPFVESDYYVSVNSVMPQINNKNQDVWSQAEQDCHHIFQGTGRDGRLLSVETKDELKFLRSTSERFGSGKEYLTSGIYTDKWIWGATNATVPPFAIPKKIGPTKGDRIVFHPINRFKSTFDVLQDSGPQRYICEVLESQPTFPSPTSSTTVSSRTRSTFPPTEPPTTVPSHTEIYDYNEFYDSLSTSVNS